MTEVRARARKEAELLKEDSRSAVAAARKAASPARRAGLSVVVGVGLFAVALTALGAPVATGFVGVALVLYGLLFVDVDAGKRRFGR